ncbi:MAG: DUF2927 domain-containing protein [Pseudomonadota bacterium]
MAALGPCRRSARWPARLAALALLPLAACTGQPSAEDYAAYEATLLAVGDLRTDTAPPDAPFTNDDLVRNFSRVALRHEVDIERPGSDDNAATNPLQRWEEPIRYRIVGQGVTEADRIEVAAFLDRIGDITGRAVSRAPFPPAEDAPGRAGVAGDEGVNLMILITEPAERPAVSEALGQLHPALQRSFDLWRRSPSVVCAATNLVAEQDSHAIVFGMIMLGSEVGGLLRRSCIHEEITQALGLGNDHPEVRPSNFTDDEEFALLTRHDEWLLRVLYDPRLRPGMTEDEAMPIVRRIVEELRPGNEPRREALGGAGRTSPGQGRVGSGTATQGGAGTSTRGGAEIGAGTGSGIDRGIDPGSEAARDATAGIGAAAGAGPSG